MLFFATILRRFVRYKGMLVNFIFSKGWVGSPIPLLKGCIISRGVVGERRGFRDRYTLCPFPDLHSFIFTARSYAFAIRRPRQSKNGIKMALIDIEGRPTVGDGNHVTVFVAVGGGEAQLAPLRTIAAPGAPLTNLRREKDDTQCFLSLTHA